MTDLHPKAAALADARAREAEAGRRVSDAELTDQWLRAYVQSHHQVQHIRNLSLDLRDVRAEIEALRAKLAMAERERDEARSLVQKAVGPIGQLTARAERAESALATMTTERDAAHDKGWIAGRDAAVECATKLRHPDYSAENEDWCKGTLAAADAIAALTPPTTGAGSAEPADISHPNTAGEEQS